MNASDGRLGGGQVRQHLGPALVAWALFGLVGLKYVAALGLALWAVHAAKRDHRHLNWREAPALPWALALLALQGLSLAWTPAPERLALGQWALYSQMLLASGLALALPSRWATRLRQHFVGAAAGVGLAILVCGDGPPGAGPTHSQWLLHSTVGAEGNQRIAVSMLLALAAVWALQLAAERTSSPKQRWGWGLAFGAILLGLLSQDRRSGMVALPFLLAGWAWMGLPSWRQRLLAWSAILVVALGLGSTVPTVRERLEEGIREVQQYEPGQAPTTSWGLRLALNQTGLAMWAERPGLGWGIGAWEGVLRERVPPQSLLSQMRTAHNEYLQVAVQNGGLGLLLLLGWGLALMRAARGQAAKPEAAAVALALMAVAGLFNAVLRDATFALPLLVLLGASLAQAPPQAPPKAPQ